MKIPWEDNMTAEVRLLDNRWDDAYAAKLDEPGKLLYRSNLLGADKRITNYGGGNTSAKVMETDPLTREIFGEDIGWLPWRRPGFQLGLDLEAFVKAHPNSKGVVLESHGLFTWANDAKDCYELTLAIINKAIQWFAAKTEGKTIFGG